MQTTLIQLQKRVEDLEKLADEVSNLAERLSKGEAVQPELSIKGQQWYRGARELMVQHTYSGLDDFDGCYKMRIPMMSISHSDLMPIRKERSDAGLSQCETVIDIRQEFSCFFFVLIHREFLSCGFLCFGALTEGARRATGVSAPKHIAARPYSTFFPPRPPFSFRIESPCNSMR